MARGLPAQSGNDRQSQRRFVGAKGEGRVPLLGSICQRAEHGFQRSLDSGCRASSPTARGLSASACVSGELLELGCKAAEEPSLSYLNTSQPLGIVHLMHERTIERDPGRLGTPLLSINECAAFLGVARSTVYELVKRGDLRAVRVGERWRFRPADVDDYLERGSP